MKRVKIKDSVFCSARPTAAVHELLSQIYGLLAYEGRYISVSYAAPEQRLKHFEAFAWQTEVFEVPKPLLSTTVSVTKEEPSGMHYVYVCVKPPAPEPSEVSEEAKD